MKITKEELIDYLKKHLNISIKISREDNTRYIEVNLHLLNSPNDFPDKKNIIATSLDTIDLD